MVLGLAHKVFDRTNVLLALFLSNVFRVYNRNFFSVQGVEEYQVAFPLVRAKEFIGRSFPSQGLYHGESGRLYGELVVQLFVCFGKGDFYVHQIGRASCRERV